VALTPQNTDTFMREVDDAVREDALRGFLSRYGKPLLAAIVLGLAGFAGWLYWQSAQDGAAGARGMEFSRALDNFEQGRPKAAGRAVDALASGDSPGYRAAALMLQGNAAAAEGNLQLAATRFGSVANDANMPQELRDMALLRQTLVAYDTLEPETVVARLRRIVADPTNGVFPSAAELTALAELRRNNTRRAGQLFLQISRAENASDSLKSRATQMAGMLGVDAIADDEDEEDGQAAAAPAANDQPATKE
jgi:hypothetical protein